MKKRLLAIVVMIALIVSMLPVGALAEGVEASGGTYVSLGGSNVNGYGLRGYIKAADGMTIDETYEAAALDSSIKDNANVLGYLAEAPGGYPVLVADELGYDLEQLAISSMRVEELRILLDSDYYGDSYSAWRFVGSGKWFEIATEGGIDTLREEYQAKIAEADFITVDIGANNFGVYISHQLTSNYRYDEDIALIDPALAKVYNAAKAYVKEIVVEYAPEYSDIILGMDQLMDTMTYALVGFCVNFDIVMEKIYELNPDATVVTVSIQNLMEGYQISLPGIDGTLPLGEIFGGLVNAANVYIAVGSPYSNSYYCADVRQNGRVECFLEDIIAYNGDPTSLKSEIIDCFNVLDGSPGNGYDRNLHVKYMLYKYILTTVLGGVDENYVAAMMGCYGVNSVDKLASKLLADEKNDFASAGDAAVLCQQVYAAYEAYMSENEVVVGAMLNAAYDAVASMLQEAATVEVIDLVVLTGADEAEDAFEDAFAAQIMAAAMGVLEGQYDYELPENFFETVAEEAGVSVSAVESVAALYVRTDIGNTFFGHPNQAGHETVANAVLSALENETTGMDIIEDEILIARESALYDATHGEYDSYCGSYYVSLGDSTVTGRGANYGVDPDGYENYGYMTTVAESFPYQLADMLELDVGSQYMQLGMAALRTSDLRYILDEDFTPDEYTLDYVQNIIADCAGSIDAMRETYEDELAMADLVTISIGNCNFSDYVKVQASGLVSELIQNELATNQDLASLLEFAGFEVSAYIDANATTYDLDWDSYLSDEAQTYLFDIIDEITAGFVENGVPEEIKLDVFKTIDSNGKLTVLYDKYYVTIPVKEIVSRLVEWYAYAYITHTVDYMAVLDLVHEMAPNAQVVVVGMYNPMDELVIVNGDNEIALGDYVDYFAEAVNLSGTAYAMLNSYDTTFVNVPEVESNMDFVLEQSGSTMEVTDFLLMLVSAATSSQAIFHETTAGHTYIAECIFDALSPSISEHSYKAVVTKPTCTEGGYTTYTCVCGDSYVGNYTEATGHDHEAVVTEPTCTEGGYTTYTCHCGDSYVANHTEATGHTKGEAKVENVVSPGCTSNGSHDEVVYCTVCHIELSRKSVTDPAVGHKDEDNNDSCDVCGADLSAPDPVVPDPVVPDPVAPVEPSEPEKPEEPVSGHCSSCNQDVCHTDEFEDLDSEAWYHQYTDYVLCHKLMNGMGESTFGPNVTTTRGMVVTILYRLAGSPAMTGEMPFVDVAAGQWYSDAILWAYQNNIVDGYGNGNFGPSDIVTREQMATILWRNAKYQGIDVSAGENTNILSYDDALEVSEWAVPAVQWAVAVKLMEGRSATELAPAADTTRVETATLFYRWCEEILK